MQDLHHSRSAYPLEYGHRFQGAFSTGGSLVIRFFSYLVKATRLACAGLLLYRWHEK